MAEEAPEATSEATEARDAATEARDAAMAREAVVFRASVPVAMAAAKLPPALEASVGGWPPAPGAMAAAMPAAATTPVLGAVTELGSQRKDAEAVTAADRAWAAAEEAARAAEDSVAIAVEEAMQAEGRAVVASAGEGGMEAEGRAVAAVTAREERGRKVGRTGAVATVVGAWLEAVAVAVAALEAVEWAAEGAAAEARAAGYLAAGGKAAGGVEATRAVATRVAVA